MSLGRTHDEFRAYQAALADELGHDVVGNGDQLKRRNARQREPVIAESEPAPLKLTVVVIPRTRGREPTPASEWIGPEPVARPGGSA